MNALYGAVAALVAAFYLGWQVHSWKAGAEETKRLQEAQELANEQQRMVNRASAQFQGQRAVREARERVVIREVERVLEKPVYREQCLDADGLRLVTEDIDASNARRGLGAAVPAASTPVR